MVGALLAALIYEFIIKIPATPVTVAPEEKLPTIQLNIKSSSTANSNV